MYCEIILYTPPNGAFVGVRGNVISGVLKYDNRHSNYMGRLEAAIVGTGILKIEHLQKKDDQENPETEIRRENYLHANIVTHDPVGFQEYVTPFEIEIPHDVPPSLDYHNNGLRYNVSCKIEYHIKVRFNAFADFRDVKLFKKDINIIAGLVPKLPMTSVTFEGEKKLTQIFSSKKSYVKIKATIHSSVLRCGEKIQLQCEVINDTNIIIKEIKAKVIEIYTFKSTDGSEIVMQEKVPYTDKKTESLQSGETQEMPIEINMPLDRASLEFANIVSKEYFVLITVKLPMPHKNYEVKIPLQFGHILHEQGDYLNNGTWELMDEDNDVMFQNLIN